MRYIVDIVHGWFRPTCECCGKPKPKFTRVCNRCWMWLP